MYKYGTVDPYIISELGKRRYDIYLLTNIDIPWINDKLREHPTKRTYFLDQFESELKLINANYHIIRGSEEQRLLKATKIIDDYISFRDVQ
jgi:nicotinamide riboside kinase